MKRLILVRHAKSSWKDPGLADFDRPLNKRGKKDAPFMGKRLKLMKIQPDLIISSSAKRALKTAKIIAKEIDYSSRKIIESDSAYSDNALGLLKIIQNIDDSINQIMIIGHNPDLTYLSEFLTNKKINNIPTCGVVCMDFDSDSWKEVKQGQGIFNFFDYPKKYTS